MEVLVDPSDQPRWVSAEELSALTGVSRKTLRRLARDGVIPRLVIGRRTHLYDLDDVCKALHQQFQVEPAVGAC